MYTTVGVSRHASDAYKAGYEAVTEAHTQAKNENITHPLSCVFLFCSTFYEQEQVLSGARAAAGDVMICGSSAAGELSCAGPSKKSVVAMCIFSDDFSVRAEYVPNGAQSEFQDVQKLMQALECHTDDKALILFPDVLSSNASQVVAAIQETLPDNMILVGGASGDDFDFEKTYSYTNGAVHSGGTSGVVLSGAFFTESVVGHGWQPIGVPMTVTRAEGSIVYEIDDKPAIQAYEEYFGRERIAAIGNEPFARIAITYPLGVYVDDVHYILATPITLNESDGSITFAATLSEDTSVRLMMSTKDDAVIAAQKAAQELKHRFDVAGATLAGVLVFNCIARERLFGTGGDREIQAVSDVIGAHVPLAGFYTYGEVGPIAYTSDTTAERGARFHNETIVLMGLGARSTQDPRE